MPKTAVLLVLSISLTAFSLPSLAREPGEPNPVAAGRSQVSGILSLSGNYFAAGAGFGYFVADGLIPGVRYIFQYTWDTTYDYDTTTHDVNLFLRYYFADFGDVLPFVVGEAGWLKYSESSEDSGSSMSAAMFSVFGGGGLVIFLSRNFSLEALAGVRRYLNVPKEVGPGFDRTPFEFRFGFGVYL